MCTSMFFVIFYRLVLPESSRQKGSRLNSTEKKMLDERKKCIQKDLKSRLGLVVDMTKQGKNFI